MHLFFFLIFYRQTPFMLYFMFVKSINNMNDLYFFYDLLTRIFFFSSIEEEKLFIWAFYDLFDRDRMSRAGKIYYL